MTTVTQQRIRARPAHPAGPTFLTYTPNGRKLITAGSNNVVRVYTTGSDDEPVNLDDCQENNTSVAATNEFFLLGSEDGTVCMYSLETYSYEKMLTRSSLPIRDIAISPDGQWAAVASDELTVKIVNLEDSIQMLQLQDLPKSVKHVTFDPTGSYVAASCLDGIIYIFKLGKDGPELFQKIDGVTRTVDPESETTTKAAWHPDGRAFVAATATRDAVVVSHRDGERQRQFSGGHIKDLTALAWSPNGAMLLTAAADGKVLLWDTKSLKVVASYDYANVTNIVWHSHENIVSFVTSNGELFINNDFVPTDLTDLLKKSLQSAPFNRDPLVEKSGNARKPLVNGTKDLPERGYDRSATPDSLDSLIQGEDEDGFVVDDDGAGYVNERKRGNDHLGILDEPIHKRRGSRDTTRIHQSFQPGSTPWRGNRKYLCVNLIGFVWTVNQDTHNTITVEFHDREFHRDFHFTDAYLYDKACLNEKGTLFSCPPRDGETAMIFYRPHETWTSRADWRTSLPRGEDVTSIALSDSFIVVTTTAEYVRIYTLYGTPYRVYRQKSSPTVTCASWHNYVLTLGNGPVLGHGSTQLLYTIENVKRDEVCQAEDIMAIPSNSSIKSVFFSDLGDPCIYDSLGVLSVLQHWRIPGQARWVPLLDTKQLDRLASGKRDESYWPVALADGKFHCIILKGGDQYPYFPKPLLSEFELKIPISSAPSRLDAEEEDTAVAEGPRLEESFVRNSILLSLLQDAIDSTQAAPSQRAELARQELEVDKTLLQLLNVECREGEAKGMKALEIVGLMRDTNGKMVDAASKIAGRYGQTLLQEKINELADSR